MRRATFATAVTTVFGGSAVLLGFVFGITLGAAYCGGSVLYAQEKPAAPAAVPANPPAVPVAKAPEFVPVPENVVNALDEAQRKMAIAEAMRELVMKEVDHANLEFQRLWQSVQVPNAVIQRGPDGKLVYAPKPPDPKK